MRDWTGRELKNLRRRMGWSQADVARRLNCEASLIAAWEKEEVYPHRTHERMLELLARHTESSNRDMESHAIADSELERQGLTQIDWAEIEGRLPSSSIE